MAILESILLIDDDSTTNFINQLLIEEMQLANELLIALNGREALNLLEKKCLENNYCPDLILLDINMPVMDGFQFLERYHELYPDQNNSIVIMVTTSLNPNDIKKAKELNVKGYINKPLHEEALREVLRKYFE